MDSYLKKSLFLIVVVVVSCLATYYIGCYVTKSEPIKVSKPVVVEPDYDFTLGKDVYVADNMNDENLAIADTNKTISFWYVTFKIHLKDGSDSEYEGFTIVELNTSYFDFGNALLAIEPKLNISRDYGCIQFYKRVPVETYKAFFKSGLK